MSGKKFKFTFENVLKLRHHEAEKARLDLADAVRERELQETAVSEANRRLAEIVTSSRAGSAVDPRSLKQYDSFRRDAQRACTEAQRLLTQKRRAELEARSRLAERRRAEEALVHLHDEQRVAHQREFEAGELAFIDEQAISIHYRRK